LTWIPKGTWPLFRSLLGALHYSIAQVLYLDFFRQEKATSVVCIANFGDSPIQQVGLATSSNLQQTTFGLGILLLFGSGQRTFFRPPTSNNYGGHQATIFGAICQPFHLTGRAFFPDFLSEQPNPSFHPATRTNQHILPPANLSRAPGLFGPFRGEKFPPHFRPRWPFLGQTKTVQTPSLSWRDPNQPHSPGGLLL